MVAYNISSLYKRILDISFKHKLGHLGSYITAAGIIAEIYDIKDVEDLFVLSSGHAALALYICNEKYYGIDAEEMLMKHGGHPHHDEDNHIHCSTGSLGLGINIAIGRALARPERKVYVLISDGECAEGSVWEALKTIHELNINNIEVYVNCNGYAAYKKVDVVYLSERLRAFLPKIHIRHTYSEHIPCLHGLNAHYHVMSKQDYQEALKVI